MKNSMQNFLAILMVATAIFITGCTDESLADLSISEADQQTENSNVSFRSPNGVGNHYVFTMDNATDENSVLAFPRNNDGTLGEPVAYLTGGTGTGGGLGSQGAITDAGRFLLVVNAGSNEISVFNKSGSGELTLVDVEPSGGERPTSVTVHNNLVYVMNTGGSGNIAGFSFSNQGDLTYLEGSSQPFSSDAAAPAQIAFDPSGDLLVVTERATNRITSYIVDNEGLAGAPTSFASAGQTPFGFDWGIHGEIIVSEAFGGAAGASTVSSYDLNNVGDVTLIEGPVPTNQSAACWVIVTQNGRFAYTTNTASGTVSGFRIASNGELELLHADGVTATTGAGPIDADVNNSSKFLYTLNAGDESISIFTINKDGSLTYAGSVEGLPDGAVGMIAD